MGTFGENLRKRAQVLGLSSAEVARRAGLSERRYGNYVIGRREPDLVTLRRIAGVLGSTIDGLLTEGENSSASWRELLSQRLQAAASVLDQRDMELIVVQVEAAAQLRASPHEDG